MSFLILTDMSAKEGSLKRDDPNYYKEYYQKNRDKILEKVECSCGKIVSPNNLKVHQKTDEHKRIMKLKKEIKKLQKQLANGVE